jgi:exosortase
MKPSFPHKNSSVALSIKVATILFATLAIYHQDLTILGNEAIRSELMNYTLAIPSLLAYILYRKRKMIRAAVPFETINPNRKPTYAREIVGVLLCLTAFFLYSHGSYTFHPLEYHMISLPLFTAGLILIIFNTKTLKVLAFPIAFLLFLTPPPLEIVYAAGATLSTFSSEAAYNFLKAIGLPVSLADQYGTPMIILQKPEALPLTFAIDIACAGMYSLIGFTIFAVFVAYIARGSSWKKATVFLAGIPLIYTLNITRIIIIVLMGNQYGMEAAMQAFHLLGGWALIFIGTLILLTISEKLFKIQLFTPKPKIMPCNYCNQNSENNQHFCATCGRLLNPMNLKLSKRDLSKILILAISAILIINLQVPVFALTEGSAEVTIQTLGGEQTIKQILPEIPGYTTEFIYRDKRFEEVAKQDASLLYAYRPTDTSKTTLWVTIEIAKTRSVLDRWEVCLITWPLTKGYQPRVTQLSLRDVQLLQNPPITARYFAFQDTKSNITQIVLYWYENALFNTGSSQEQEHVKISLIAFSDNPENIHQIEEMLLPFGLAIANYWQPIKTWSQTALTIAQQGDKLIAIPTALLAIIFIIQAIRKKKDKKSNLKLFNKLASPEEKLILQAVQATQKSKPTGSTIASQYEKLTKKAIETELVLKKLDEAEEAGLIRREIINQEDEPLLVWKSWIL